LSALVGKREFDIIDTQCSHEDCSYFKVPFVTFN